MSPGRDALRIDDEALPSLERAVRDLGGTIEEIDWSVVGSQEITRGVVRLPGGELELHMETYEGIRVQGPQPLVDAVRRALARVHPTGADGPASGTPRTATLRGPRALRDGEPVPDGFCVVRTEVSPIDGATIRYVAPRPTWRLG